MKLVANRMSVCGLAVLLSLGIGRSAAAQMADTTRTTDTTAVVKIEPVQRTVYRTKQPTSPPAAKREIKGAAPSAKAVWVPGRWLEPPVRHARWDPGHWGWYDDWYSWIPGHWVVKGRYGYPQELQSDQMSEFEMSAP